MTLSGGRVFRFMGFTLIEMMIVLVILSVVLIVAIPSYQTIGLRTKLRAYTNELVTSAYLARGEAIKRNAQIRMCISSDGTTCQEAGDWDEGWVVMDPNDTVIKYKQGVSDIDIFAGGGVHTVVFRPSGVSSTPATLTICRPDGMASVEARQVTIAASGRPSSKSMQLVCSP